MAVRLGTSSFGARAGGSFSRLISKGWDCSVKVIEAGAEECAAKKVDSELRKSSLQQM